MTRRLGCQRQITRRELGMMRHGRPDGTLMGLIDTLHWRCCTVASAVLYSSTIHPHIRVCAFVDVDAMQEFICNSNVICCEQNRKTINDFNMTSGQSYSTPRVCLLFRLPSTITTVPAPSAVSRQVTTPFNIYWKIMYISFLKSYMGFCNPRRTLMKSKKIRLNLVAFNTSNSE